MHEVCSDAKRGVCNARVVFVVCSRGWVAVSPEATQPAWAEQAPSLLLVGILVFFLPPLRGISVLCPFVAVEGTRCAACCAPLPTQPFILINTQPLAACRRIWIND